MSIFVFKVRSRPGLSPLASYLPRLSTNWYTAAAPEMTTPAEKASSDMKCWAVPMLFLAMFSGNLFIFIIGIIGCSTVLCCSSAKNQTAIYQAANCFKGCAIACAVLGGLHAIGMLALGAVFANLIDVCSETMTDNSCNHLVVARRLDSRQASPGSLHIGAALGKYAMHAPLLLGALTGGTSLLIPRTSLGATLTKPSHGTPALAPTIRGATGGRHLASDSPVSGCGQHWGNLYILASPGATDCYGCGTRVSSFDDCKRAAVAASAVGGVGVGVIGDLDDKENWKGPQGCYVQDGVRFRNFDPHSFENPGGSNYGGVIYDRDACGQCGCDPEPGHTLVCFCELNADGTACREYFEKCGGRDDDGDNDEEEEPGFSNSAQCKDHVRDSPCTCSHCCWSSWDEPFACEKAGYRPELTGSYCWDDTSKFEMACKRDSSYSDQDDCEAHMKQTCEEQLGGFVGYFFAWMVWAIIGTIVYSVAACKAAKVPSSIQDPAQGGNQMQPAVPHATAQPAVLATVVAQPVAQVPMPAVYAQPTAAAAPVAYGNGAPAVDTSGITMGIVLPAEARLDAVVGLQSKFCAGCGNQLKGVGTFCASCGQMRA